MKNHVMGATIGRILLMEAAFLVPPMALCLWDGEGRNARAFLWAIGLCAAAGAVLCAMHSLVQKEPSIRRVLGVFSGAQVVE